MYLGLPSTKMYCCRKTTRKKHVTSQSANFLLYIAKSFPLSFSFPSRVHSGPLLLFICFPFLLDPTDVLHQQEHEQPRQSRQPHTLRPSDGRLRRCSLPARRPPLSSRLSRLSFSFQGLSESNAAEATFIRSMDEMGKGRGRGEEREDDGRGPLASLVTGCVIRQTCVKANHTLPPRDFEFFKAADCHMPTLHPMC